MGLINQRENLEKAEVFGLLLLLWRYYAQKAIVFALSPPALGTSLRQPSPLPEGGYVGDPVHSFSKYPLKYQLSHRFR